LEDKREDYQNCSVLYCVPITRKILEGSAPIFVATLEIHEFAVLCTDAVSANVNRLLRLLPAEVVDDVLKTSTVFVVVRVVEDVVVVTVS